MSNKKYQSRRNFLRNTSMVAAGVPFLKWDNFHLPGKKMEIVRNTPQTLVSNPKLDLSFGEERMIMNEGLQPFMLCTKSGTIIVQAQLPKKPYPQERIFYPSAISTVISRDGGKEWLTYTLKEGDNGLNMEGGVIQLKDGSILALETYITPGQKPGSGEGLLYFSKDDWRTLEGPVNITFNIPNANFYASSDDGGRPHVAMRLHRRIIELPNGDLLTTIYGCLDGDKEPAGYIPTMMKTRSMLFRSSNKGRHWDFISTIAVDPKVGTEGFDEPVLTRVSKGTHKGRLICQMRTGRDLYESFSDNEGRTWSKAIPRLYADLDVYRTEKWAEMFKGFKRKGELIENNPNEFIGAVVDPDLLELRSGILVAAFGVRIPPRACWTNPTHPWNGNYLAFSLNQGDSWSHVVRLTTGIFTTHYMAIEETPEDNSIFIAYDFGHWTNKDGRYTYGRPLKISLKA
ncbi:MAG: sialidase family protein [Chitinophagaceae bacterium]